MNVVPWDGVYRIQNVAYPEQKIGLKAQDVFVVGRHEDSADPRIEWEIKATKVGDDGSNITIQSDSHYVGVDSEKVVYNTTFYEWGVSYREVGRWTIRDSSGLLVYLPDGADGTEVRLMEDVGDPRSYWRFIPIRPPSN